MALGLADAAVRRARWRFARYVGRMPTNLVDLVDCVVGWLAHGMREGWIGSVGSVDSQLRYLLSFLQLTTQWIGLRGFPPSLHKIIYFLKEDLRPVAHHPPLSETQFRHLQSKLDQMDAETSCFVDLLCLTGWRPVDLGRSLWDGTHLVCNQYKTQRHGLFPPLLCLISEDLVFRKTWHYLGQRKDSPLLFLANPTQLRAIGSSHVGFRIGAFGLRVRALRALGQVLPLSDLQVHTRHRRTRTLETNYLGTSVTLAQRRVQEAMRSLQPMGTIPSPNS